MKKKIVMYLEDSGLQDAVSELLEDESTDVLRVDSIKDAAVVFGDRLCCGAIVGGCMPFSELLEIFTRLRDIQKAPILALLYDACDDNQIAALEAGATVCLAFPCDAMQCYAQMRSLTRLYLTNWKELESCTLSFENGLVIEPEFRSVKIAGERIFLSRREFSLLHCLALREGQPISRQELFRKVWNGQADHEVDEVVKATIKNLRRKINDKEHQYIENVHGIGYRFVDRE